MKPFNAGSLCLFAIVGCLCVAGCATGSKDRSGLFAGTGGSADDAGDLGGAGGSDDASVHDASGGSDDAAGTGGSGGSSGGSGGGANCGNNVLEPGESCDGEKHGGQTCISLHFGAGTLACSDLCTFDTSGCGPCSQTPLGTWNGTKIQHTSGDTCSGSNDFDGKNCTEIASPGKENVYSLVVPPHRTVHVSVTPKNGFEAAVWVSKSCADVEANECVAGKSDASSGAIDVINDSNEASAYFIVVDGTANAVACGTYELEVTGDIPTGCGNGVIGPYEECDDTTLGGQTCKTRGFDGGTLRCTSICTMDTKDCWSGVSPLWECDPSRFNAGDGCDCGCGDFDPDCADAKSSSCTKCDGTGSCATKCLEIEPSTNWRCISQGVCGDGSVGPFEQCDGVNLAGATCITQGFSFGTLACSSSCTYDTTACHNCGNGTIQAGEQCDGANLGGATCASRGFAGGVLKCAPSCSFDTTGCNYCGNGLIEPGETCDGTSFNGATCATQGYYGGTLACTAACTLNTSACNNCGNGVVNSGEECDGSSLGGKTCASQGFVGGTLACQSDCILDTRACHRCGNGMIDPGEQCDGASLGGATCGSMGYYAGTLGCTVSCGYDTSGCNNCGNGLLDYGEQCDGANVNSQSCASLGLGTGAVSCQSNCTFDTSSCVGPLQTMVGCDPSYCTWTVGGGPNGGNLCDCTIPGSVHPTLNKVNVPEQSYTTYGVGPELVIQIPNTGYTHFTADTCFDLAANSTLSAFSVDPTGTTSGNGLIGINDDSMMTNHCSRLGDSAGTPIPFPLTSSGALWLVVDSYGSSYWNGYSARRFQYEMIGGSCGDGIVSGREQCDTYNLNGKTCNNLGFYNGTLACNSACGFDLTGCNLPSYWMGCASGQTLRKYVFSGGPISIPDNSSPGVEAPIVVPYAGTVYIAATMLSINHTFVGDLEVNLLVPGGFNEGKIINRRGGSGANFTRTLLDSDCPTGLGSGVAPFTNCYSPDIGYSSLPGNNLSGAWILRVRDVLPLYTGSIQNWAVLLCTAP